MFLKKGLVTALAAAALSIAAFSFVLLNGRSGPADAGIPGGGGGNAAGGGSGVGDGKNGVVEEDAISAVFPLHLVTSLEKRIGPNNREEKKVVFDNPIEPRSGQRMVTNELVSKSMERGGGPGPDGPGVPGGFPGGSGGFGGAGVAGPLGSPAPAPAPDGDKDGKNGGFPRSPSSLPLTRLDYDKNSLDGQTPASFETTESFFDVFFGIHVPGYTKEVKENKVEYKTSTGKKFAEVKRPGAGDDDREDGEDKKKSPDKKADDKKADVSPPGREVRFSVELNKLASNQADSVRKDLRLVEGARLLCPAPEPPRDDKKDEKPEPPPDDKK